MRSAYKFDMLDRQQQIAICCSNTDSNNNNKGHSNGNNTSNNNDSKSREKYDKRTKLLTALVVEPNATTHTTT